MNDGLVAFCIKVKVLKGCYFAFLPVIAALTFLGLHYLFWFALFEHSSGNRIYGFDDFFRHLGYSVFIHPVGKGLITWEAYQFGRVRLVAIALGNSP